MHAIDGPWRNAGSTIVGSSDEGEGRIRTQGLPCLRLLKHGEPWVSNQLEQQTTGREQMMMHCEEKKDCGYSPPPPIGTTPNPLAPAPSTMPSSTAALVA